MWLNESLMTNRRYAIPLGTRRESERANHAQALFPAAVAYLNRWAK
jgi:hypothetical protein